VSAAELAPAAAPASAHEPPEARGLERDEVAMLVAARGAGTIAHARFHDLPGFLEPGDLLVVNTSATLPAALDARLGDREVKLHLSTPAAAGAWVVELRTRDGEPFARPPIGARLRLPGDAHADLLAPFAGGERLCVARLALGEPLESYLAENGRPISYGYVPARWPIDAYQTVFARQPGSAEMPSAGRPFTADLVTELVTRGVPMAPIILHAGVSSPERGEAPYAERYEVPAATAWLANAVRERGGRVVAVGTTVVRALETAARPDGTVGAAAGWTGLVITAERGLRAVDGLLTGWHDADSSHLQLLEAVAGGELLARSYREAVEHEYLFHEFGDTHLILP
jgi:S-adenosylmethionine:tRNA ribosyltransferase-isomerase